MTGLPIRPRLLVLVTAVVMASTGMSFVTDFAKWVGSWSETGATLEISTRLTYPFVAAVGAWIAAGPRRQRFDHLLAGAGRPRVRLYARAGIAIALAAVGGTVLPVVVACVFTGREADFVSFPAVGLLVVWSGMFAAAAFGILVGSVLPPIITGPVALAAVYAVPLFADTGRPSLAPLAGLMVADDRDRTYMQTTTEILGVRVLLLVAVGWLCVALAARSSNRWLVPFALCCLLATPLLIAGTSAMRPTPHAEDEVCADKTGAVTICLTRARSHAEPGVRRALQPFTKFVRPLAPGGVLYREEGLVGPRAATYSGDRLVIPLAPANGIQGSAHRVDGPDMWVGLLSRILSDRCPTSSDLNQEGTSYGTASEVLDEWALRELHIPLDGSGPFGTTPYDLADLDWSKVATFRDAWRSASPTVRDAWLGRHRVAVVECSLRPEDLVL